MQHGSEGCLYQKQGSGSLFCFHNSPTHVASCSATAPSTASPSAAVLLTSPPNITVALLPSLTVGTTATTGTTGTTTTVTTTTTTTITTTTTTQSVEDVW